MNHRHPTLRRTVALIFTAVVVPISAGSTLTGCGKDAATGHAASKAKVATQVGSAAGTAKHYIFDPAVLTALETKGAGHEAAMNEAATASEFTVRALAQAQKEAAKDPKLKTLAQQLQASGASIGALTVVLRSGKTPPKSLLTGSEGTIQSVENAARDAGITVKDTVAQNLSGT